MKGLEEMIQPCCVVCNEPLEFSEWNERLNRDRVMEEIVFKDEGVRERKMPIPKCVGCELPFGKEPWGRDEEEVVERMAKALTSFVMVERQFDKDFDLFTPIEIRR